jgi:hypothetical protein
MTQVISLIGALIILAAFGGGQFKLLSTSSLLYAVLNLIGSAILAVIAWIESQWGFVLLEGVWALISLWSTIQLLRGGRANASEQT